MNDRPDKDQDSRIREQRGWYFYDWANSAFSTTVVTVFLGPYLTAVTESAADANGLVYPLGIPVLLVIVDVRRAIVAAGNQPPERVGGIFS